MHATSSPTVPTEGAGGGGHGVVKEPAAVDQERVPVDRAVHRGAATMLRYRGEPVARPDAGDGEFEPARGAIQQNRAPDPQFKYGAPEREREEINEPFIFEEYQSVHNR